MLPAGPNHHHSRHHKTLRQSVIVMPLRDELLTEKKAVAKGKKPQLFSIIIDLNLEYPGKRAGAMQWVVEKLNELIEKMTQDKAHRTRGLNADKMLKNQYSQQYMFVEAEAVVIQELVRQDAEQEAATTDHKKGKTRAIYHVWADFELSSHMNKSIATIKGDAAHASYAAFGDGIVWAVMDSGIDGTHPHFETHATLKVETPLTHADFTTPTGATNAALALTDEFGHGTHVAGIIAGSWNSKTFPKAYCSQHDELGNTTFIAVDTNSLTGMASKCKLLSLKVLDGDGKGKASNLIAAIAMIQEINGYGRHLLIHGANMSVGYEFDPEWFACGQSPLCVEVNRLVRSGVVVVVAAGNTGYGTAATMEGRKSSGINMTINDPGNADLAITVGATHRVMPHVYGVSYFSSKGPTGDGRLKPDLVAPGERILSCAAGKDKIDVEADTESQERDYVEKSGTSMAAPHVSGAIAAFLSIRSEFIGQPEAVKETFMNAATDLKREKHFQGSGLVDLMRAIQSV
jgi:serine protease AprX